jgi:hypothetical protein
MLYQITERFGWFNCVAAFVCLIGIMTFGTVEGYSAESVGMVLILQAFIGASIVYASQQKAAGTDIGEKAYPATLAAYVLFILFAYRFLYGG